MTVDIRATVSCSLGTLISASLSDDYIQGSGLIRTKGSCEISGLVRPAVGSVVTFSYTKGGISRQIPRRMRVLSSFADPFRRVTQVELGCTLTYFRDLKPAPTVNEGETTYETGRRQECLNGFIEYPADSPYGIPIKASDMMKVCLEKLGITASQNPLTNVFYKDTFEFTNGYVNVLSDLLVSESYCGYLNANDKLVVFSLEPKDDDDSPVISADDLVDVAGIGVGEMPGDAVVVRYESLKLDTTAAGAEGEDEILAENNWEREEVSGEPYSIYISAQEPTGQTIGTYVFSHAPHSVTTTTYGKDETQNNTVCVLYGSAVDLSDSPIYRRTESSVCLAEQAGDYLGQLIGAAVSPELTGNRTAYAVTEEYFDYDDKGQQSRVTKYYYEPYFMWAGRLSLDLVLDAGTFFTLGDAPVLVRKEVQEIETLYARMPSYINNDDPDTKIEPLVNGQKVVTKVYETWGATQQGQQAIAATREFHELMLVAPAAGYTGVSQMQIFLYNLGQLQLRDVQVQTSTKRVAIGYSKRPKQQLRLEQANGTRTTTTSELLYVSGSPTGKRIVEFSMPYQSDDHYDSTGTIIKGDAEAKANRYGRTQNKLLQGNRLGMNVQAAPEKLPAQPFAPFVVQAGGVSGQYRTNGTTWQMSSEGVLVSTDALFWGGVGGSGGSTPWFPTAPGITTLPAEPTITDTSPSEVIGTVATVGTTPQTVLDAAFPNAVAGDGVQDLATDEFWVYDGTTWENVGTNPGPTMTVTTTVPVWNEVVRAEGRIRLKAEVVSLGYPLEVLTEIPVLRTKLSAGVTRIKKVEVPSVGMSVAALAPQVAFGVSARVPAAGVAVVAGVPLVSSSAVVVVPSTGIAVAALTPVVVGGASVAVPAVAVDVAALAPVSAGPQGLLLEVPAVDVTVAGVAPAVATGASAEVPAVNAQVASSTPSAVGAYDPSFSSVSLLLHMDGSNNGTTFVDNSTNALNITANGTAKISTAQSKFGGSSAVFTTDGAYLSCSNTTGAVTFAANNFTVECWIYPINPNVDPYGAERCIVGLWSATTPGAQAWMLYLSTTTIRFIGDIISNDNILINVAHGFSEQWYHVAVVRNSGTITLYINGASAGAASVGTSGFTTGSNTIGIGGYNRGTTSKSTFNGYIDELRITKGVARYTSNFTPPTAAFPNS
jgi:hypothetical protein